jgi:hypothetical protein
MIAFFISQSPSVSTSCTSTPASSEQPNAQRLGLGVDAFGDVADAVRAVVHAVHRGNDREENLRGADIAGRAA